MKDKKMARYNLLTQNLIIKGFSLYTYKGIEHWSITPLNSEQGCTLLKNNKELKKDLLRQERAEKQALGVEFLELDKWVNKRKKELKL